jgi:pyruvate,water dikinase
VDENALQPRILGTLQRVDPNQPATLKAASVQIGDLFAAGRVPADVAAAIEAAYADLANPQCPVAVCSSATAEDLPDASFAGQQETFLNVQGAVEVLEAVKRCWASLWTARAIGYRARQGTAPACVLYGPQDFGKMKPGDVLVATTTTPAWTPLFTMASAVVTDIGGPLSHSSIVAREYGIPAVMAARDATRHIQSGQMITVDGAKGTVVLNEQG